MFRWQHLIINGFTFPRFKFNRSLLDEYSTSAASEGLELLLYGNMCLHGVTGRAYGAYFPPYRSGAGTIN
jgi:hypothetical protein